MFSLNQFKLDWFNHPEWWFSASHESDMLIRNKYEHLLDTIHTNEDPLTLILVYDQLPRHIYRSQPANHIIEYYLQQALAVIRSHIDTPYEHDLTAQEWTFFLLPLRHTKCHTNIINVIERTWHRLTDEKNNDIYRRYLKATYQRFLRDFENQTPLMEVPDERTTHNQQHDFTNLLAFNPLSYNDTTQQQTDDLLAFSLNSIDTTKQIIISLSGGVDSMVCSFVLKHYQPQSNIIAVHINYDNRPQCALEVAFLQQWCKHLDIPLNVRTIKEIHREPCMKYDLRDLYESYTRDVRYLTYKSVSKEAQVVLGHNLDDCLENIMTNIAQKNKYDNLKGMSIRTEQDDITFIRPLLETSKENIIKYARNNNIPFLPNSTPAWSQRGQIRNNIVPCLDKWDNRFVPSLFELTDKMSNLYKLLQQSVSLFIAKGHVEVHCPNLQFVIETIPCNELVTIDMFWKEFFVLLDFKQHVSTKSLNNLIECIQKFQQTILGVQKGETRRVMVAKHLCFAMMKIDSNNMIKLKVFRT